MPKFRIHDFLFLVPIWSATYILSHMQDYVFECWYLYVIFIYIWHNKYRCVYKILEYFLLLLLTIKITTENS